MEGVYQWGLTVIEWLQQASPALDPVFLSFTFVGEDPFLLMLLPAVYWSVDSKAGLRLMLVFLASVAVNGLAKVMFAQPRPADFSHTVSTLVDASGFGLPSGHAQAAVVLAGFMYWRWRTPQMLGVGLLVAFGTSVSRVYLGVHFPTDVLGGVALGLAVLLLAQQLGPPLASWFVEKALAVRMILAVLPGVGAILVRPDTAGYAAAGAMIGVFTGLVLTVHLGGLADPHTFWQRMVRLAIGMSVLFALFFGLGGLFGAVGPSRVLEMLRYFSAGWWVVLGAPLLFARMAPSSLPAS